MSQCPTDLQEFFRAKATYDRRKTKIDNRRRQNGIDLLKLFVQLPVCISLQLPFVYAQGTTYYTNSTHRPQFNRRNKRHERNKESEKWSKKNHLVNDMQWLNIVSFSVCVYSFSPWREVKKTEYVVNSETTHKLMLNGVNTYFFFIFFFRSYSFDRSAAVALQLSALYCVDGVVKLYITTSSTNNFSYHISLLALVSSCDLFSSILNAAII